MSGSDCDELQWMLDVVDVQEIFLVELCKRENETLACGHIHRHSQDGYKTSPLWKIHFSARFCALFWRSFFLLYIYQIYHSWLDVDEKILLKNFGVISIPDSSCYCGWRACSSSFVLHYISLCVDHSEHRIQGYLSHPRTNTSHCRSMMNRHKPHIMIQLQA